MAVTIKFGNVNFKIMENIADTINNQIAKELSYAIGGFGQAKEVKTVYNVKTQMSYTGLLPYVIKILKKNGISANLVDIREKISVENQANFQLAENVQLRDYQQNAINNLMTRGIIQAATGAGKTCILAAAIAKFNVKPVVVISPKATLAYQLRDEISRFLGVKVGVMTGMDTDICDITICTPQMAIKSGILDDCKAIMYDECQFLAGKTIFNTSRIAKNAYYRLAVSATPWRDGEDDILIEAAINTRNPKSNISASILINKGKLTPCEINFVKFHHVDGWQGNYGKTYNKCIVNNSSRNQVVVDLVKKHQHDKGTTLVLFSRVEHGNILLNMIREQIGNVKQKFIYNNNIYIINSVELVNGSTDMENRAAILAAAKKGIVRVFLGSTIADEGLDIPILKTLILAGAGKSSTRAFQRIGRVLRLYEGLNKATIYDFCDDNPTFQHHFFYRKALYETEPEWKKNIKFLDM